MSIELKANVQLAGYYKIEIENRITGKRTTVVDWVKNKITDYGLNEIGEGTTFTNLALITNSFEGVTLGHLIRTPAYPERAPSAVYPPYIYQPAPQYLPFPNSIGVEMGGILESSSVISTDIGSNGGEPFYGYYRRVFRFNTNDVFTANSVGLCKKTWVPWSYGSGNNHPQGGFYFWSFFSNTSLKDENGNPITLTKNINDIVDVTFELRCYAPTGDKTGSFTYDGNEYSYKLRPANKNSSSSYYLNWVPINQFGLNYAWLYSGPIGGEYSQPTGSNSTTLYPYKSTNYVRWSFEQKSSVNVGLDSCNYVNGIKSLMWECYRCLGDWQVEFTPALPKTRYKSIRLDFGNAWSEYVPP